MGVLKDQLLIRFGGAVGAVDAFPSELALAQGADVEVVVEHFLDRNDTPGATSHQFG